jgi:hypothetical protein
MTKSFEPVTAMTVPVEEKNALAKQAEKYVKSAAEFECATVDDFEMLGAIMSRISAAKKAAEGVYERPRAAAHAAWKAVTEELASVIKPLDDARAALNSKGLAWTNEQKRIAQAEEQRQQAEYRRQVQAAEDERRRLQAEEDELRASEVTKAQAEAAAKGADAAELAKIEETAPVVEIEVFVPPPPAPVAPALTASAGAARRQKWTATVDDLDKLLKAAVEGHGMAAAIVKHPDVAEEIRKVASRLAATMKDSLKAPGVTAKDEGTLATMRRA